MNYKVKRKLSRMREIVKMIDANLEMILQDIDDVEESDDLYIVEAKFDSIASAAKAGYDLVRETYDEFEEE